MTLDASRMVNVVFALLADSFETGNRLDVIEKIQTWLRGAFTPNAETWGVDPAYIEAQRGNMGTFGPPPGWSPKRKLKDEQTIE